MEGPTPTTVGVYKKNNPDCSGEDPHKLDETLDYGYFLRMLYLFPVYLMDNLLSVFILLFTIHLMPQSSKLGVSLSLLNY